MKRTTLTQLSGAVLTALLLLVGLATAGNAVAAPGGVIIQSVRSGVPNAGDDRVVFAELFSRDG